MEVSKSSIYGDGSIGFLNCCLYSPVFRSSNLEPIFNLDLTFFYFFSGKYECLASNEIGQVRHQGELNVYGPAIVRPMTNKTVVGNERLVLNCPVGGYPIQSIWWEKGRNFSKIYSKELDF